MLWSQFRTLPATAFTDVIVDRRSTTYCGSSAPNSLSYSSYSPPPDHHLSCRFIYRSRPARSKLLPICCNSSSNGKSADTGHDRDDDYVEAVVLMSETLMHYRMRKHGYQEEKKWRSPGQFYPFSSQKKDPRRDINTIDSGLLRHYPYPTIFLKISCDGDYLLPIIVGEYAVEKLINSSKEDNIGVKLSWTKLVLFAYFHIDFLNGLLQDCPNAFQLTRNIVERLGYKVKMVRVTERVGNIYYARIYFQKPGKEDILRVDARPSDAINVAERCRAPIYVNKQIVLTDAIRMAYGMSRLYDTKSVYDVSLDSAIDGRDELAEELDMVTNMNLAVKEERYSDAAMWRDKLAKFREPRHNP